MEMRTADYGSGYNYPAALHAAAKVDDWSYGNDTAAHLHVELPNGHFLSVFVEHALRSKREEPEVSRFTVLGWDEENEQPDVTGEVFETEDPYALIGYVFAEGER